MICKLVFFDKTWDGNGKQSSEQFPKNINLRKTFPNIELHVYIMGYLIGVQSVQR